MSAKLIRIKHARAKYVTISQVCAEDSRLSWGAKGLFVYLHGRPEGWVVNFTDLYQRSEKDGNTRLKRYIKELQQFGYLKIERLKDEQGRFTGTMWTTDDEPQTIAVVDVAPYVRKPSCGKPARRRTDDIQYNNIKNKQKEKQQQQGPGNLDESQQKKEQNVVVVPSFSEKIKTPCQNGKKCKHFSDLDTVKRAFEIFRTDSDKKTITNPIGYVCGVCQRGAIIPATVDPVETAKAERAERKAEEAERASLKAKAAAAKEAFLKLPENEITKYINNIKKTMGLRVSETILVDVAATAWAEANHER